MIPVAGHRGLNRVCLLEDVARGDYIVAATGVTDGSLLRGGKPRGGGTETTESVVMRPITSTFRWVRTEHRQTEGKSAYP